MKQYPYNMVPEYFWKEYGIDESTKYTIEEVDAKVLLTPERIDLMAKWYYIDAYVKGQDMTFSRTIYAEHIKAFSEGTFTEPGSEEKNSLQKYYDSFEQIIDSIQSEGFDENKSLVLVGKNNVLLDGSHRVATAAYFNKKVKILRFAEKMQCFDAVFFAQRGLNLEILDYMVLKYCELKEHLYMACLWPKAKGTEKREKAIGILKGDATLLYVRDFKLSSTAQKHFMQQIYRHHDWVGTVENQHAGAKIKSDACYSALGNLTIVLFAQEDLDTVLMKKEMVRELFGIENHSLHITDNATETKQMAEIILNRNCRNHLFYGEPDAFPSFNKMVDDYKETVSTHKQDINDYVSDTSSILAVYGIRDAGDVDFLTKVPEISLENKLYENHPSLYPISVDSVIDQPLYHFVYMGIKYVSPYMLYRMKLIRGSEKDPADCAKLKKLLKKGKIKCGTEVSLSKLQKALVDKIWAK